MEVQVLKNVGFCLWWLFVNGFVYYAEYDFLLRFTAGSGQTPPCLQSRSQILGVLYIAVNCIFTFLAIWFQISGFLSTLLHTLFLCGFSVTVLTYRFVESVAPAAVIFTLTTFMNGISTVIMRYVVNQVMAPATGILIQVVLSALLSILFFLTLRRLSLRYGFTARQTISSYLYILLLPCAFMIWVLWFGLRLDENILPSDFALSVSLSPVWAFCCLFGAFSTFAVVIHVFDKVVTLGNRETEEALLKDRLREQQIYLSEARKRDEQYRSFQHDINNHLLVLAGLMEEEKYREVRQYMKRLTLDSGRLMYQVATGNAVLDILLREKLSYAKQNGISVDCRVAFPADTGIDDIDLCVIFSNALDNAVAACLRLQRKNMTLTVTAGAGHQFLIIEVTNSWELPGQVRLGTGLKNIKQTAEKYQGTMEICQENNLFRLSVLLCGISPAAVPKEE